MKILKALLVFVLLIFLTIFIASFLTPSEYKNDVSVQVNANIEKSFYVFNNENNMKEWLTGFVSIEILSGQYNQVGSTYKVVMSNEGREVIMTETITSYKKNEYFAFDLENDDIFSSIDISFTTIDSAQTEISVKTLFIPKAMFVKALMPFFEDGMNKRQQTSYNNLKKFIEASPSLVNKMNMINETK